MDTFTAIHTRRTIHAWAESTIDDDVIDTLLQAAHQAPCHKKTWPWRFIVVGPETREALVPVGVQLAAAKAGVSPGPKVERSVRGKVTRPAALIAVAMVRSDDPFLHKENYAATACAVQNLMLAATAVGLGSKWGTGGLTRHVETLSILGVDSSAEDVVGFIFVGKPARIPEIGRPPVAAHITRLP